MLAKQRQTLVIALAAGIQFFLATGPGFAQLPTIGATGASYTDEYYPLPWGGGYDGNTSARGWVQHLMLSRGPESDRPELTFGSYVGNVSTRWTPRYAGYEYNWARTGASTHTLLTEGQHTSLAAQVENGEVDFAFMAIAGNDFTTFDLDRIGSSVPLGLINVYGPIYSQQTPFEGSDGQNYDSVEDYIASVVDRYEQAVDTVAASGARLVLGTGIDYNTGPQTRASYPDPVRRQYVSDAVAVVNSAVREMAADRGVYGVDMNGIVTLSASPDPLIIGGVEIVKSSPSSPDPHYFFLSDDLHAGTVVQGLIANAFIEAMNRGYGTGFTPLSDQEILANAGIADPNPGSAPTYYDVSQFVFPETSVNTDFNHDGMVDVADVDALVAEIVNRSNDPLFDLSGDEVVNGVDLEEWLAVAATHNGWTAPYLFGDTNLDGTVNSIDLNNLALQWRQSVALWSAGDFTADGEVSAGDLNLLALNWRQSISPAATRQVPEPTTWILVILGLAVLPRFRRSQNTSFSTHRWS